MTKEKVFELAREVGFDYTYDQKFYIKLEQFAESVIKEYNSQPLPTNDGLHWDIKL